MEAMKIYILTSNYVTGGTELLHQLFFEIKQIQPNIYIKMVSVDGENDKIQSAFAKYVNADDYLDFKEIEDSKNTCIIYPEIVFHLSRYFIKSNNIFYWLSVDNFKKYDLVSIERLRVLGLRTLLKKTLKGELLFSAKYAKRASANFCQSQYALNYLEKNHINNGKFLSDYINSDYFENLGIKRSNTVCYNPSKMSDATKKLLNISKIDFIPLTGLPNYEMKKALQSSKVYVDFGHHPGKDRIPREAAISGCCIITNKEGSAAFYEDLPIPDKYKFENPDQQIEEITQLINSCFKNYESHIKDFYEYQEKIRNEQNQFKSDVSAMLAMLAELAVSIS